MTTAYDVDQQELVAKAAQELKKVPEVKAPEWGAFVKTSMHKQRPPVEHDWWHMRVASVLRTVYRLGPIGVSKLRTKYGGKKNRGVKKEHFFRGSGNILRKSLQQLEKAGLIKFVEKGVHKGRIVTPKGKEFLDTLATQMKANAPKQQQAVQPEPVQEQKADAKKEKPAKKEQKAEQENAKP